MIKFIKHLAAMMLQSEIRTSNEKIKNLKKWVIKLEDAIVDEDKTILVQAMFSVAQRRDQEIKITSQINKKKLIKNDIDFKVYTYPMILTLVDKKHKN